MTRGDGPLPGSRLATPVKNRKNDESIAIGDAVDEIRKSTYSNAPDFSANYGQVAASTSVEKLFSRPGRRR
jgi:hypothetical protein